jgi:hypothetical protein
VGIITSVSITASKFHFLRQNQRINTVGHRSPRDIVYMELGRVNRSPDQSRILEQSRMLVGDET